MAEKNAEKGKVFILTQKGYENAGDMLKTGREIGKPLRGYEENVTLEWIENGYVKEVNVKEMEIPAQQTENPEQEKEPEPVVVEKHNPEQKQEKEPGDPAPVTEEKHNPEQKQEKEETKNPFEALLKLAEKSAPEEAAALRELQQHMIEMDNHYKDVCAQMQSLREQLAEHSDTELSRKAVGSLEKNADGLKAHNDKFKKNIFQRAADIIRSFKARGTIALNNVVQKLGVKESLQEERKYYQDNAAKMQKAIDKLDAINSEINAAKNHVKNIGRLAVGKEAVPPRQDKENIIIKILKVSYVQNRDMYNQMTEKTDKKIDRLEGLEEKAAKARSTIAKLSDYKKEAASRSENRQEQEKQDRENVKKEPQMAL